MAGGQGAAKRSKIKRAKIKQEAKKEAKRYEKFVASMPKITEEDLLNFQITHFGDDSKPERWFVPAEEALNFKVFEEIEPEDDGLGYYPDGVKRTLTDEQIAIFRRTELWQMKRDQQRAKEEERARRESEDHGRDRAPSPASESSLEDELLAYANIQRRKEESPPPPLSPQRSRDERSETAVSDASKKRKRSDEVPYDQRNKRKWEKHIAEVDPDEGSITHRRLARELDNQQNESVDMDY